MIFSRLVKNLPLTSVDKFRTSILVFWTWCQLLRKRIIKETKRSQKKWHNCFQKVWMSSWIRTLKMWWRMILDIKDKFQFKNWEPWRVNGRRCTKMLCMKTVKPAFKILITWNRISNKSKKILFWLLSKLKRMWQLTMMFMDN